MSVGATGRVQGLVFLDRDGDRAPSATADRPLPVMKARRRLSTMAGGAALWVETTDPLAAIDIPHFCNEDGHALEASERVEAGHRFLIRKKV